MNTSNNEVEFVLKAAARIKRHTDNSRYKETLADKRGGRERKQIVKRAKLRPDYVKQQRQCDEE